MALHIILQPGNILLLTQFAVILQQSQSSRQEIIPIPCLALIMTIFKFILTTYKDNVLNTIANSDYYNNMNSIELTIIFLLLSTVSHAQQTSTSNAGIESHQDQEQTQPIYALLLDQQCAIGESHSQLKAQIRNTFRHIMMVLPWPYLICSLYCTSLIARYYHNGWFGLFYTVLNLIKIMQNGLFYLNYCEDYEGNPTKGKIFFATILLASTWKLFGIIFSSKLTKKQRMSLAAYFSFLAVSILFLREYCDIMLQFFYIYFHFLQSNFAAKNLSYAQAERKSSIQLFLFFINLMIFSLTTSHPQISLATLDQRTLFYGMIPVSMSAGFFYEHPKELKKVLLWLKGNLILRPLGYQLQTDKCAICWQEMDIYGGVDNLEELSGMCCHGLVRVHKNHIFHKKCLLKWRLTKKTCPLDNERIPI